MGMGLLFFMAVIFLVLSICECKCLQADTLGCFDSLGFGRLAL